MAPTKIYRELPILIFLGLSFNIIKHADAYTEKDAHLEAFLKTKLESYNERLTQHDPLPPTVEPVNLFTDQEQDDGVNANFTITSYYMSGYSKPLTNIYHVYSELDATPGKYLHIDEAHNYKNQFHIFEGNYAVNGTILSDVGDEVSVPFQGKGKFRLESNYTFQMFQLTNYTVTDDHVDLDQTLANNNLYKYAAVISWSTIAFAGLDLNEGFLIETTISNNRLAADDLINRIKLALAGRYKRFLVTGAVYPIKQQPLKRILVEYLKEIFLLTSFSDIITGQALPPDGNGVGSSLTYSWLGIYLTVLMGICIPEKMQFGLL